MAPLKSPPTEVRTLRADVHVGTEASETGQPAGGASRTQPAGGASRMQPAGGASRGRQRLLSGTKTSGTEELRGRHGEERKQKIDKMSVKT